jgi:hypothetical protein
MTCGLRPLGGHASQGLPVPIDSGVKAGGVGHPLPTVFYVWEHPVSSPHSSASDAFARNQETAEVRNHRTDPTRSHRTCPTWIRHTHPLRDRRSDRNRDYRTCPTRIRHTHPLRDRRSDRSRDYRTRPTRIRHTHPPCGCPMDPTCGDGPIDSTRDDRSNSRRNH